MQHRVDLKHPGAVAARCPVCGMIVPFMDVTVHRYGFLKRRVGIILDGDATDFVAHLWTHRADMVNSDI